MPNPSDMLAQARQLQPQLVAWRRDFHMFPELGFQEMRTAGQVAAALAPLGYRLRTGVGRTGVIADLGAGEPLVAIRADMDALPIQETNAVPYASQVPGVMHACGHDAHTAIALGAATLLARLFAAEHLPGAVRFLFQPSEEMADEENVSGAPRLIAAGAMQGVQAVLAQHTDPAIPTGCISIDSGVYSAGVDTFYISVIGKGGHGAAPHKVVDPIYLAGHLILALHGIVSRRLHPFDPAVVSIGSIHGGQVENVIPEQVDLIGTIRYQEPEVQQQVHAGVRAACELVRALGGDYHLRIDLGYPPMVNDPQVVETFQQVAGALLGADRLLPRRREMGAEDFAYFSQLAPGAMFRLGARLEGSERKQHHPAFDIDEACLPVGAALLAETARRILLG
jgi:amidohydrolase